MKTVSKHRKSLVALVVVVIVVAMVMAVAMAQPAPGQGEQQGQDRQDRGQRAPRMMGMMGGTALAVEGNAVFVVTGGMLLKYDAETLELLAQADLPRRERPERRDREQAPE